MRTSVLETHTETCTDLSLERIDVDMEEVAQVQSTINAGNGKETTNHRDQAASNKDEGDYTELDGEAHQSTYLLRGAAKQSESEPVPSDTAFTEAQRLFLADELFSAGLQDYNLNGIFDSLKSTFPPAAAPVQNKSPEPEGRSVPRDHVNALLKPAITNRTSRFGWMGKRKVSDASELAESMVFGGKFVVEHSEAYPRASPSSSVLNFDNDGMDIKSTSRGNEIDEDDFRPCQGNDENLRELGEEDLMKTMGWFPVEEYPNEDNDVTLPLHWIVDEPPCASDLPHLESLMEISPSKFWSPNSESSKRPLVQFGYLNSSESPQSSHSIQYFLSDSPTSSPEMTRTILGGASGLRISSKESNHRCPRASRNIHGTEQKILTPICLTGESMEASMKSPSLGSDRILDAQVQCVPQKSPALSEDNPMKNASRDLNMATLDHTHHQETGSIANRTASDTAARRLQLSQCGKNLVMEFLEVGRTQENIEAQLQRTDIPHRDTTVQSLWTQNENTSDQTRLQCLTGISTKEREIALPSFELQITLGADGNLSTKRASQVEKKRDVPLVPLSDISNHPNLATSLRNSLHEKLESQLLYLKPLSESLKNERLVTFQCPEPTPDNFAWSTPTIPRVSRKRSNRITTPKLTRVDVLNLFGNGKVAQPVRTTPDKDFYTCKRRKTTRTFVEVPMSQRNVKLQSTPASDCEIDLREMGMQEGTSSQKPPILTRIIKPLRLIKTSPAKGYTRVHRKWTLRSTARNRLPTDPRNLNAMQFVQNGPVKHRGDVSEAVVMSGKNPGSSGSVIHRHEVEEDTLQTLPAGFEMSNSGILRSSKYRGVTRHRHTGRYEAHLWDNTKVKLGLAKGGDKFILNYAKRLVRVVMSSNVNDTSEESKFSVRISSSNFAGAYPNEEHAAQAHDLAALKYWGPNVYTNFPPSLYQEELKTMKNRTKEEYIVILRRRSPGFTRGISKYRGVTRHHQEGRWEARIGRHSGAKYHYLGTYDTQEEAAAAYDRAAVRNRGVNAITNFDISNYIETKSKANKTVSLISSPSGQS